MNGYALDANTISFLLRKDRRVQNKVYQEANGGKGVIIPAIAYYEVKRGLIDHHATRKIKDFERLCNMIGIDKIDDRTLDKAAEIYAALKKAGQLIEDADILIAASCIVHNYTLVTDNIKHLERIDGLQIENWLEQP
jgi:predicted nucleic acid-binding protein